MATILITHGVPASRFSLLRPNRVIIPPAGEAFSRTELLSQLPECDVVLACGAFDRTLMEACKQCKLIVCYGAGYDAIDIPAATAMGLPVANIPDSVTETTAELAMAQLLALTRRVCEMDRRIRAAEDTRPLFTMGQSMGVLLEGMTLGVVGMGRIGARMAEFGRFIGMRIVYHSREIKPFSVAGNARRLPLEELLRVSDVVSLHCPLTPETFHLLGKAQFALMRPTAFLINASRGKLIDEPALIDALTTGRLAGAALDVFETEPEVSRQLKAMEQVVLTPHIGSNTLRTRNQMAEQCCERILDQLAGRKPANLLNAEVWPRKLANNL
ncbi:MAG TPA: NAD(P)-dependent oxidoreductase [Candidatus Limiplasma sp.]|nr:NAD(P)-dependent oxidoreductase [Candidatus Limiplasma sp.]